MRFPETDLPDVVYMEYLTGAHYIDKPEEVERLRSGDGTPFGRGHVTRPDQGDPVRDAEGDLRTHDRRGLQRNTRARELPDLEVAASRRYAGQRGAFEMARLPDGQIAVRNAADPDGPALIYTRAEIEGAHWRRAGRRFRRAPRVARPIPQQRHKRQKIKTGQSERGARLSPHPAR